MGHEEGNKEGEKGRNSTLCSSLSLSPDSCSDLLLQESRFDPISLLALAANIRISIRRLSSQQEDIYWHSLLLLADAAVAASAMDRMGPDVPGIHTGNERDD